MAFQEDRKELTNYKILVVEDDPASRKLIVEMLDVMGITNVVAVEHGQAALRKTRFQKLDLIICDWNLPHMNGLEFYKTAKREGALGSTPFLMVSVENQREKIVEAFSVGIKDYLIKPLSQKMLEDKVKKLLKI